MSADEPSSLDSMSEKDERKRLLPTKSSANSNKLPEKVDDRTEKQQFLEFAVYSLEFMLIVFLGSLVLATALTIVRESNENYMPLWVIFSCLWLGHLIIFGVSVRVLQLLFRSLIPGYEKDKLTNKVLRTNEKRIALAQFTLFNLLWLHGISIMAILFEILLYLALSNVVPAYACLIPMYIVATLAVMNALVCRTIPFSSGLSWICIFIFCILCNLKVNDETNLSWTIVFIPILLLVSLWLSIFLFVLFMYSMSVFILKKHQLESVLLYFLSSFGAIIAISLFLNTDSMTDESSRKNWIEIATAVTLFCLVVFSIGLVKAADATIALVIDRMGSDRPQSLVRSEQGWEVDPTKSFEQYPFIGEVETTRPQTKGDEDGCLFLPFCGCCTSITVLDLLGGSKTASTTPNNSRNASASEFESLA